MKNKRRLHTTTIVGLVVVVISCIVCLSSGVAYGKVGSVTGTDYYYGAGETSNTVDILSITGEANDTVFVEVKQGQRTIASHLAFTLGEGTSEKQGDSYVGVMSATMANFNPNDAYTVKVYADREQTKPLYEGTIRPVYAQIEGSEPRLIALRTIGEEQREFHAPASVSFDGATYELAAEQPVSEAPLTYAYKLITDTNSVSGSVSYVDDKGNVLKTESIPDIAQGTSKIVSVPSVITVGEGAQSTYWRTVNFNGSVTAANPGTKDFTVPCKPLSYEEGVGNVGNYYFATINLVDAQGNRLATDTLNVTGKYRYTAPARLHLSDKDGFVNTYVLSGQNENVNANGVLELDPAVDNVTTGSKTYEVKYDLLPSDAEATWTVNLVNGAADPKSSERKIETKKLVVKPGETVKFAPEKQMKVGDETYVAASSTKDEYSFTYGSGQEPTLNVYYVPDGYVEPEPYEITVRYVNIANNEVLQSEKLVCRPQDRDVLEITSPETFTVGGVEYVRLDGQSKPVFHSYYSSARTYTIYYRDVNDDLSANIVITRVNVEYVDGGTTTTTTDNGTTTTNNGTTTTDNGTTTTDGGTTTTDGGTTDGGTAGTTGTDGGTAGQTAAGNEAAGGDGTATAAIPDGDGLTVINGADNALVTDGEGRDTNTMRIEDDANPLAGPGSSAAKGSPMMTAAIAGGIAAAVALGALIFFVVFKRRKKNSEKA